MLISTFSPAACPKDRRIPTGFTLIELLVVIGVIGVLIAITVPVVSKIRQAGYRADTANQISVLQTAINAYFGVFQAFPGPYDHNDLYGGPPRRTMSENLVLGLIGGIPTSDQKNKPNWGYDPMLLGTGPRSLNPANPKVYQPFLASFDGWLSNRDGPFKDSSGRITCADSDVPEFIDRYPSEPMPILYLRARKGSPGIISGTRTNDIAQYSLLQILPYTNATINGRPQGLRDLGQLSDSIHSRHALPYFKDPKATENHNLSDPARGVPRCKDGFILISAGPDRIYGTTDDITNFGNIAD